MDSSFLGPFRPSAGGGRQNNWLNNITVGQCFPPHAWIFCWTGEVQQHSILHAERSITPYPSSQQLLYFKTIIAPNKVNKSSYHVFCTSLFAQFFHFLIGLLCFLCTYSIPTHILYIFFFPRLMHFCFYKSMPNYMLRVLIKCMQCLAKELTFLHYFTTTILIV